MGTIEQNRNKNTKSGSRVPPDDKNFKAGRSRTENRPPNKNRKDAVNDKRIILAEALCGLLLLLLVGFGAVRIFGLLDNVKESALGAETFRALSNMVRTVVLLEIFGIILLFGGMILARVFRLRGRFRLERKQKLVLLAMELAGLLFLVIDLFLGYSFYSELKQSALGIAQLVKSAGRIGYVMLAAVLLIAAAPVYGEVLCFRKDGTTPAVGKAAAMLMKGAGAVLILAGIGLTAHTVSGSMNLVEALLNEIHSSFHIDTATRPEEIQQNLTEGETRHMSGYINIAVFGIDSRADKEENQEAGRLVDSDSRSDVIMIVSINCDTKQVKLLSVYRDTRLWVQKRKNDSIIDNYEKITHAYFNGGRIETRNTDGTVSNRGPEFALNAVNRNLDLNITEYVSVNFDIVRQCIESLDGLDIDISKGELKYINQYIDEINQLSGTDSPHITETGLQHLDGVQATGYARIRHSDNDYKRTERQREVVQLMLEKAKTMGITKVMEIVNMAAPQIRTNIEADRFHDLALDVLDYDIVEQRGFPFNPYWDKKQKIVYAGGDLSNGKDLVDEVIQLHEFLFGTTDYTPSETLKEISAELDRMRGKKDSSVKENQDVNDRTPAVTPTPAPGPTHNSREQQPQKTAAPTPRPTAVPTPRPTAVPTSRPTAAPTPEPTAVPTLQPTAAPEPTLEPTPEPTPEATPEPAPEVPADTKPEDVQGSS